MNSIVKGDTARWTADMTVRQRYTDIPQFEEKPVWFSRMGVSEDADSLLASTCVIPQVSALALCALTESSTVCR